MGFLNACSDFARDKELNLGEAGACAASAAEKGDCVHLLVVGGYQGAAHILAITAAAEGGEHVPGLAKGLDLAGEDVVELVIVADRGEVAVVDSERKGRGRDGDRGCSGRRTRW